MKVLLVLSVLTWTLVQNTGGNLLELGGGGGFGGYYQQYTPQPIPQLPIVPPIVEPRGPNLCELGAAAQLPGRCDCQGYSIQICPFSVLSSAAGIEMALEEHHKIAEIIDVKLVDEVTGEILGEEIEEYDVTEQFYPYSHHGRNPFVGGGTITTGYYPPQIPRFQAPQVYSPPQVYSQPQVYNQLPQVYNQPPQGFIQPQGHILGGFGIQPPYMPGASRSLDE